MSFRNIPNILIILNIPSFPNFPIILNFLICLSIPNILNILIIPNILTSQTIKKAVLVAPLSSIVSPRSFLLVMVTDYWLVTDCRLPDL